ncbi:MAG: hypothetical protein M1812_006106 [Candelaria pacifica]|nr:MAG: hypothetical protein M1812_006106 [Candelaria pacifica]
MTATALTPESRTRVHISPFNQSLLSAVLPPSILPRATNISYHHLQTFPERDYGYVELPAMDAEKVKKKLNGSILKGSKIRVEEARPKKRRTPDVETAAEEQDKPRKRKKRKTERDVLPGVELTDRKVQRGWTKLPSHTKTAKDKKSKSETSAYSTNSECLFRTTLPSNASSSQHPTTKTSSKSEEKKNKKRAGREAVVHEFSKTTKHASFLRDKQAVKGSKTVTQYVDGKGWVDEQGGLVEAAKTGIHKHPTSSAKSQEAKERGDKSSKLQAAVDSKHIEERDSEPVIPEDDQTSSNGSSSDESSAESESVSEAESERDYSTARPTISITKTTTSKYKTPKPGKAASNGHQTTSDTGITSSIKVTAPSPKASSPPKDIHPLETIFKQPNPKSSATNPKPTLQVKTSFSFFEPDGEEQPPATGTIPQTPFTQRDFQERGLRSAAPTPDTAAPGRSFPSGWVKNEEDEEEIKKVEVSLSPKKALGRKDSTAEEVAMGKSSFKDWFWEHRGDTNRAWKKRRREMAKEKRKRENKRRSGRIL